MENSFPFPSRGLGGRRFPMESYNNKEGRPSFFPLEPLALPGPPARATATKTSGERAPLPFPSLKAAMRGFSLFSLFYQKVHFPILYHSKSIGDFPAEGHPRHHPHPLPQTSHLPSFLSTPPFSACLARPPARLILYRFLAPIFLVAEKRETFVEAQPFAINPLSFSGGGTLAAAVAWPLSSSSAACPSKKSPPCWSSTSANPQHDETSLVEETATTLSTQ